MVSVCSHSVCNCLLQGYQGLVDGGENIRPATWESVSMMLQLVSEVQPSKQTQNHKMQPNHTRHIYYILHCFCSVYSQWQLKCIVVLLKGRFTQKQYIFHFIPLVSSHAYTVILNFFTEECRFNRHHWDPIILLGILLLLRNSNSTAPSPQSYLTRTAIMLTVVPLTQHTNSPCQ